jgi:hypothetical protein
MGASLSLESPPVSREVSKEGFLDDSAYPSVTILNTKPLNEGFLFYNAETQLDQSPIMNNVRTPKNKPDLKMETLSAILGASRLEAPFRLTDMTSYFSGMQIGESRSPSVKHLIMDDKKPMNAAMAAFRKKESKSIVTKESIHGGSSHASTSSLEDIFGKPPGSVSSRKSFKKKPTQSPETKRRQSVFEQRLVEITHSTDDVQPHLESLPIERLGDLKDFKKRKGIIQKYRMKKFNSTSTIFLESTIMNSDVDEYLK